MRFTKAILAASIGFVVGTANASTFDLTVAHINDTHSSFDAAKSSFKMKDNIIYNEFGGYARLAQQAKIYRNKAKDNDDSFLFLHGGDAFQGSAYFKINKGEMNATLLNLMGLDAMAMGNHEFDLGTGTLNSFISSLEFPMVAANVDTSNDANLSTQTNLKPYVIYEFDGYNKTLINDVSKVKNKDNLVAVVGLALDDMKDIADKTGDVEFIDDVKAAQQAVNTLESIGVTKIIGLTHIGNKRDLYLASKVNGLDIIVGGHSHTLLGDFSNLGMENSGTYAQMVKNPNGVTQTCVVQAGAFAQAMGLFRASFINGQLESCRGNNKLLSNDVFYRDQMRNHRLSESMDSKVMNFIDNTNNITMTDEDALIKNTIDSKYKPALDKAYGSSIAFLPSPINHVRRPYDKGSDSHGSDVAPLIALAQYQWASSPEVQSVTHMKPDFALVGAGSVRTDLQAGDLLEGNISMELLPFSNALSVVPLKGSVIKDLIKTTIEATLPEGSHAGKFPYSGNMRYVFTETVKGKHGRIDGIEYNEGTQEKPYWTALKDYVTYNVVMDTYHANGNDGWSPLFDAQLKHSERVDLAYMEGKLTGFKVKNLESVKETKEGVQVINKKVNYYNMDLECKLDGMDCNTDAKSVISSMSKWGLMEPLKYQTVTLNRK